MKGPENVYESSRFESHRQGVNGFHSSRGKSMRKTFKINVRKRTLIKGPEMFRFAHRWRHTELEFMYLI